MVNVQFQLSLSILVMLYTKAKQHDSNTCYFQPLLNRLKGQEGFRDFTILFCAHQLLLFSIQLLNKGPSIFGLMMLITHMIRGKRMCNWAPFNFRTKQTLIALSAQCVLQGRRVKFHAPDSS